MFVQELATTNRRAGSIIQSQVIHMNLTSAQEGKTYIIQRIETDDEELNAFLFSLGCYSGEPIRLSPAGEAASRFPSRTEDTTSTVSWLKPLLLWNNFGNSRAIR